MAYGVFTDGQRYSPQARRAALERVCLPLLRACSLVPLREFFLDHIMEIMGIIEADLSKVKTVISSLAKYVKMV